MNKIIIVSSNPYKIEEIKEIAIGFNIEIETFDMKIEELQTENRNELIRNKVLQAFNKIKLPLIVDHASLEVDSLNGMPGSLTQLFWDKLEHNLYTLSKSLGLITANAISTIGYCDGRRIHIKEAVVKGKLSSVPKGSRKFQWDTIFIPEGYRQTYGEMSVVEKNLISPRQQALKELFHEYLGHHRKT